MGVHVWRRFSPCLWKDSQSSRAHITYPNTLLPDQGHKQHSGCSGQQEWQIASSRARLTRGLSSDSVGKTGKSAPLPIEGSDSGGAAWHKKYPNARQGSSQAGSTPDVAMYCIQMLPARPTRTLSLQKT